MPSALLMDPELQQPPTKDIKAESALLETAGRWAALSLERDGGAVLEVTRNTWNHIKERLVDLGFDPDREQVEGRLVVFDTDKVIAATSAMGGPDPNAFQRVFRDAMERVRSTIGDGPIHVWTEHIALLRQYEDPWTAEFQQSLWQETARTYDAQVLGAAPPGWDPCAFASEETEGWSEYIMGSTDDRPLQPTR